MNTYDAIVIGARCAGSPTAMLLARQGHRVLLVDRATFPSDTVSSHIVHPPGVAALKRWGLLDRLVASGCPPIHTYAYSFGPFTIAGSPGMPDNRVAYCPRRTVLDKLLIDAAAEAGADVREGFTVAEVLMEGGTRGGHSRPCEGWRRGHRACRGDRRSRWMALHGGGRCRPRALQRDRTAPGRVLQLLEWPADGRPFRNLHPPAPGIRGRADQRRPDADHRRLAAPRVRAEQAERRADVPGDAGSRARVRRARGARNA